MQDQKPKTPNHPPVIVSVPLERELVSDEHTILKQINRRYKISEIELVGSERNLSARLYKLDPDKYHNDLNAIIQNSSICSRYGEDLENPFELLIQKILSIGSYGIRYRKRIYAGYAAERKVADRKEKEQKRESYYYARDAPFEERNNQVPPEYVNRIFCADSEDLLKELPDNCIDLIITSPPYNFGLDYSSSGDSAHWEEYLDKLFRVFKQGIRVLKYGGRFIVNVQPLFSDYIPLHHVISSFFMSEKMIWKGEILWEKNNYNCKYTSWGSWKSPSSPYLKYTWEFIEIFCKGSLKKPGRSENADISDEEFKSWVVAKWSIGTERRMKQYEHPAMFPEELVTRCLKLFSFKDDIILDPFNGAGTTTAVASGINRRYLGIDISNEYCATAEKRLSEERIVRPVSQKKIREEREVSAPISVEPQPKRRGRPPKQRAQTEVPSPPPLQRFLPDLN